MTKRICLVIESLQAGGMERVMSELANYFVLQPGISVHLILYGRKRDIFFELDDRIQIYKPPFLFNDQYRKWSTIRTLFFLRSQIKLINPTTILSFGEYWNNFVLIAGLGLKYPFYVSDRCQPDKSLGKVHNILRKWLYPTAKGIIAQTSKAKEIFHQFYQHRNIQVIGNPIPATLPSTIIERENIVLSVGRLIQTKHHDALIKIFSKINHPHWKLVIVGDDAIKQQNRLKLETLIADLNMADRVILAGKQKDVKSYYLKSKIFAFTSSSEGFPNVIGESLAAGLPVIAFDCIAGPSDLIQDQYNGLLIPLFDYDSFELGLTRLMEDEEVRNKLALNTVKSLAPFSIDAIGDCYMKFLLG